VFFALALCAWLAWLASWLTWQVAGRRHDVQLRTAQARWESAVANRAPETVCESFTTGWLNMLLWHMWPMFLEKEVSALFARRIAILLRRVLENRGQQGPMRFVQSIHLEVWPS